MIKVKPSPTADTRTCDVTQVSKEQLLASSIQHIDDVRKGIDFFILMLCRAGAVHDDDKISDIDGFYADFKTGFKTTEWWDAHRSLNRHHLLQADGVPADVNLVDVIDYIVDCTMAGKARSGTVTPLTIDPEVLMRAFKNTADLLNRVVAVDTPAVTEGE